MNLGSFIAILLGIVFSVDLLAAGGRPASLSCPPPPSALTVKFQKDQVEIFSPDLKSKIQLEVELADTPDQQHLGLMFRPVVPSGAGMLFRYVAPTRMAIWMKNTCASLDLLFANSNGTIQKIVPDLIPFSLTAHESPGLISSVLEIGAGEAARIGIQPGWILQLKTKSETHSTRSK
jgi:uncharacterized membrane protein (UPF0127 family)